MCTSGYIKKGTVPEKVALFSTKDKKMQKLWMKYIPRKNYIFTDKSRVCSHHFPINTHRKELVGKLVLEYLIIRNYLETKKWVKEFSQQSKSKSLRKQAKVIS